ncbi:dipeptidase, partial [Planctomycetota bacterium]
MEQKRKLLIIDTMGEIRLDYPMSLIAEIIDSGTTTVRITLGDPTLHGPEAFDNALNELAAYERHIDAHRDHFLKATRIADIDRAKNQGRMALMYLFQNTTTIADDLDKLEFFNNLGVRSIQLTYNTRNLVGDGCMERTNSGLSEFGINVVDRMNQLGMLIDLSHTCMDTMADAIKFSSKPVIISHGGCKAVYDHPRNTTDKNLKALADKGGIIGIYQINPFVGPKERNNLDDYLNHIDHAVKVAGIDHVGIGSDREHRPVPDTEEERKKLEEELANYYPDKKQKIHWPFFLSELNHPRRMETIRAGLEKRKYQTSDIEKIMGQNCYRLIKEVNG